MDLWCGSVITKKGHVNEGRYVVMSWNSCGARGRYNVVVMEVCWKGRQLDKASKEIICSKKGVARGKFCMKGKLQ